jgi:5-methylcytosine-specific restriction protein A
VERRKRWLAKHPFCAECLAETPRRVTAAGVEVDHVIPLSEGGADDETNFQTLCGPHHEAKSAAERRRAR